MSWCEIFMRQKVFLKRNIVLPHAQWQGDVSTIDMFHWTHPKKQDAALKERRANRDHASTQAAAGMCTHLARYSVGILLSPQAQDFLNRPQAQCAASRAACMHTCFQRCFEF